MTAVDVAIGLFIAATDAAPPAFQKKGNPEKAVR